MSKYRGTVKAETIIHDLLERKRYDLLFQIMAELDVDARKSFLNDILRYVLADEKLTTEVFRKNIKKSAAKKSRRIELSVAENALITTVGKEIKKLKKILESK
ncbi:MAG TPA: hypothetical protein PKN75_09605 [Bacteroidia bacterium]|nr:hypothetical protein [Bacteroidia bacterium]HNU33836.1 hypothetical protein [Bacteroidia bacterium]